MVSVCVSRHHRFVPLFRAPGPSSGRDHPRTVDAAWKPWTRRLPVVFFTAWAKTSSGSRIPAGSRTDLICRWVSSWSPPSSWLDQRRSSRPVPCSPGRRAPSSGVCSNNSPAASRSAPGTSAPGKASAGCRSPSPAWQAVGMTTPQHPSGSRTFRDIALVSSSGTATSCTGKGGQALDGRERLPAHGCQPLHLGLRQGARTVGAHEQQRVPEGQQVEAVVAADQHDLTGAGGRPADQAAAGAARDDRDAARAGGAGRSAGRPRSSVRAPRTAGRRR